MGAGVAGLCIVVFGLVLLLYLAVRHGNRRD